MFEKTSECTTFESGVVKISEALIGMWSGAHRLMRVSHFQPGGRITLVAERKSDPTRGCDQDHCSPKERSKSPRRPKLQEYLSRPMNSVLHGDLPRRNSSSQAKREATEDKSALPSPSTESKPVSK
jgi:hypothetical protein